MMFIFLFCFFDSFLFFLLLLFCSVLWNYFGTFYLFSSVLFVICSFILLFFVLII